VVNNNVKQLETTSNLPMAPSPHDQNDLKHADADEGCHDDDQYPAIGPTVVPKRSQLGFGTHRRHHPTMKIFISKRTIRQK
jgi:hypothetical protein